MRKDYETFIVLYYDLITSLHVLIYHMLNVSKSIQLSIQQKMSNISSRLKSTEVLILM